MRMRQEQAHQFFAGVTRRTDNGDFLHIQQSITVAQVSNLLYRGFPTRRPHDRPVPTDWKSAIQQVGNLRYARAQ